ncbi:(p)ppGpp synthase/HD superfamily hydrolase [Pseudorhizobium tarimense]|uniref:(P)ppGpp synthase/HD superfamily hydrolase n=1 Tax=Pseudorhizobium tarimense TaxID=1079109 RepID=A0ABV2H4G0_9HYPH|nr:HD domain-containing protein [Pseudorhizobium tarimense]MCJ8518653.1 HD domain-containing protein [Pseudorhizobium tarimense]
MTGDIDKARRIAIEAHEGQTKKTGGPIIDHVARVAAGVEGEDETIVAWLHDVVEKSPEWTLDRLRQEGFSEEVVQAVDALTKRAGEEHAELVRRASDNSLARSVKRADLADNLAQAEVSGVDASKYRIGLRILENDR